MKPSSDKATPRELKLELSTHGKTCNCLTKKVCEDREAWLTTQINKSVEPTGGGLRLFNRADGVDGLDGHYCIGREMPDNPAFVLFWNKDKFTGFGEVFTDRKSATQRLSELLELDTLRIQNEKLIEALREIEKGEGPFSLDHKQHAINTIENMKSIARAALKEVE